MTEEIHDTSRLDAYMRNRGRVAFLHAVWRPMLAGAVGAALVVGAVWVALPKFSTREIVVDHVVSRDVSVDRVVPHDVSVPNIVPHDAPVDHVVPHDVSVPNIVPKNVEIDVPRIVPHDVQVDHFVPHNVKIAIPRVVDAAPLTPAERSFVDRPEYQDAPYHGRIVMSRGGGALSFADGKDFVPAHRDPATSELVRDQDRAFDTDVFIGDFGLCRQDIGDGLWSCVAMHRGRETPIMHRRGHPA
jgi:hypothetical protein